MAEYTITDQCGNTILFKPTRIQCLLLELLDPTRQNLVVCFRRIGATTMVGFIKEHLWPELRCELIIGGPTTDWEAIEARSAQENINIIILPYTWR